METKRIDFVDLAKGICILLVVISHIEKNYHIVTDFSNMAQCFRMPLYFILSGLFFKDYGGFKNLFVKKTNKLAIPFFFFFIVNILLFPFFLHWLFPSLYQQPTVSAGYLFCFLVERSNLMPNAIWFLLCLFILNLMFYVLFIISKRITANLVSDKDSSSFFIATLVLLSIILGCIGYYLGINHINIYMYIDSALTVVPFFCFGFACRKYTNVLYPNRFDKYNYLFIIISFMIIYLLWGHLSYVENYYDISILCLYLTGIMGSLSILFIAKYIKKLPFVSYIGRYSIITLCTHGPIIYLLKAVFQLTNIDISNTACMIISFFVIVVLEMTVVIPFAIKYLPYVTAQKDLINLE